MISSNFMKFFFVLLHFDIISVSRFYYPFPPVGPMLYHMELSIGGQQFMGKGRTRQLAKHDAAAKALKVLQKEPMLQQLPVVRSSHRGMKSAREPLDSAVHTCCFSLICSLFSADER